MIRPKIFAHCTYTHEKNGALQFDADFEFSYEDVHSQPWQSNDPRANTGYWADMDDKARFHKRVHDLVHGSANDHYYKSDHLLDVDKVEDWWCYEDGVYWEIADGTWRDFLIEDVHRFIQGENVNG